MAQDIEVRRANLADAQAIADFVNNTRSGAPVTRLTVINRFGQVGFMLAYKRDQVVGLLGWQVENLVIRVTDFLIGPLADRVSAGRVLIEAMEAEGAKLLAEAAMLFLPSNPSKNLIRYWEEFDYAYQNVQDLHRAWREAVSEWNTGAEGVMVKRLRESLINRPI
jgi:N-acetylglutamate synthase-like GNAT family acetyltransferase